MSYYYEAYLSLESMIDFPKKFAKITDACLTSRKFDNYVDAVASVHALMEDVAKKLDGEFVVDLLVSNKYFAGDETDWPDDEISRFWLMDDKPRPELCRVTIKIAESKITTH